MDYIENGFDAMGKMMEKSEELMRLGRAGDNAAGVGGIAMGYAYDTLQGSQVGSMVTSVSEGAAAGGVWGAVIAAFLEVITDVMGSMENLNIVMNPITEVAEELQPLVKALLLPIAILNKLINNFIHIISPVIELLFGGFADLYDIIADTNDEREKEAELLRTLNSQYESLLESMRENEEYYLKERRKLNSDISMENYKPVNDFILSPHGSWSTSPEDYIIATKRPQDLMSGGNRPIQVVINNIAGAEVEFQENNTPDLQQLVVMIKKTTDNNIANGSHDNAFNARERRLAGVRQS
jgi:hypothetical protein